MQILDEGKGEEEGAKSKKKWKAYFMFLDNKCLSWSQLAVSLVSLYDCRSQNSHGMKIKPYHTRFREIKSLTEHQKKPLLAVKINRKDVFAILPTDANFVNFISVAP